MSVGVVLCRGVAALGSVRDSALDGVGLAVGDAVVGVAPGRVDVGVAVGVAVEVAVGESCAGWGLRLLARGLACEEGPSAAGAGTVPSCAAATSPAIPRPVSPPATRPRRRLSGTRFGGSDGLVMTVSIVRERCQHGHADNADTPDSRSGLHAAASLAGQPQGIRGLDPDGRIRVVLTGAQRTRRRRGEVRRRGRRDGTVPRHTAVVCRVITYARSAAEAARLASAASIDAAWVASWSTADRHHCCPASGRV